MSNKAVATFPANEKKWPPSGHHKTFAGLFAYICDLACTYLQRFSPVGTPRNPLQTFSIPVSATKFHSTFKKWGCR
jgi:hypothetical protein